MMVGSERLPNWRPTMDPFKKAVGQSEDWSDPKQILKEIDEARVERERLVNDSEVGDWISARIQKGRTDKS